jgi:hypothetical protein
LTALPSPSSSSQAMNVNVLYFAGTGRCGSTLVANAIGQLPGFFSAGELNFLWDAYLDPDWLCGCGSPVSGCPIWKPAIDGVCGADAEAKCRELADVYHRWVRLSYLPGIWRDRSFMVRHLAEYRRVIGDLYRVLVRTTDARVIVDSSKSPAYGCLLERTPGIKIWVAHLLRDPRGVAYSWLKKVHDPGRNRNLPRFSPAWSSIRWIGMTLASEAMWGRNRSKYRRIHYEDFVARPGYYLRQIVELTGQDCDNLPFLTQQDVVFTPNHTINGNPIRFQQNRVRLRLDDEWQNKMRRRDRLMVTALTWPLMLAMRYPVLAK